MNNCDVILLRGIIIRIIRMATPGKFGDEIHSVIRMATPRKFGDEIHSVPSHSPRGFDARCLPPEQITRGFNGIHVLLSHILNIT